MSFPYALKIPHGVWVRIRNPGTAPDYASSLMRDETTTRLLTHIVDEFVGESGRDSFLGVVVLFGEADELFYYLQNGRHARLDPVVRYLRAKGYAYIDTVDLLAKHQRATRPAEPLSLYFDATNHHSAFDEHSAVTCDGGRPCANNGG